MIRALFTSAIASITLAVIPAIGRRHPAPLTASFAASFDSSTTPERGPAPTFTRATASTKCVNGVVSTVASGSAVIGQPIASGGTCSGASGVYVGAAATFVALNNETFTGWAIGSHVTRTPQTTDVIDPAGGNNAAKVVCAGCGNAEALANSAFTSVTANQTHTCTAWARSASGTQAFRLAITEGGVTTWLSSDLSATPTWQKFVFSHAFTSGSSANCQVDGATAGGSYTLYFWHPELVLNRAFAVPLDPAVAGSAVTVNNDALSYGSLSIPRAGTLCAWVNPAQTTDSRVLDLTDGSNRIILYVASGVAKIGNGNYATKSGVTTGSWQYLCGTYDTVSGDKFAYRNASASAVDTNTVTLGATGTLWVGKDSGGSAQLEGFESGVRLYSRALTAQQITALYNSVSNQYALDPKNPARDWFYALVGPQVGKLALAEIGLSDDVIVRGARNRVETDPDLVAAWEGP